VQKSSPPTDILVVMGVSGAGKTTLAAALARALGVAFLDADDLHPPANRAKMAAGHPLDDADRAPWLAAVAEALAGWVASGQGGVTACSALKRAYRDRLRAGAPDLVVVYLEAAPELIETRVAGRRGHFFPTALVASQFAVLEPPAADEPTIRVDAALPTAEAVAQVSAALGRAG
jgi:gluconokinase